MSGPLFLAWQHLKAHPWGALTRVACVALILFLPLALHTLVGHYEARLTARADATPLILGARGSRHDLVMTGLYFRPARVDAVPHGAVEALAAEGRGRVVPLHTRFTAGGQPLVGTSPDYFEARGLTLSAGRLPQIPGEAVLGARAAERLAKGAGQTVISDQANLYDLAAQYPLELNIVGVLAPHAASGHGPDDEAVFTSIRTAWIIEGLGHGHTDLAKAAAPGQKEVVGDGSVPTYQRITRENLASFHLHGDPATFPLTAALVFPDDARAATLLKARVNHEAGATGPRLIVPRAVVDELLSVVVRVQRFMQQQLTLVIVALAGLLALIISLAWRLRRAEMDTLTALGCARGTLFALFAWEWGLVLLASAVMAALATLGALALAPAVVALV